MEYQYMDLKNLLKKWITLFFAMDHNFSQFSQHLGEFTISWDSGHIMKTNDILMEFPRNYYHSYDTLLHPLKWKINFWFKPAEHYWYKIYQSGGIREIEKKCLCFWYEWNSPWYWKNMMQHPIITIHIDFFFIQYHKW